VLVLDWDATLLYFNDMLIFDQFSLVFTALIIMVSFFWFCTSSSYFVGHVHQTDRSALAIFTMAGGIMMVAFHNMAMLFLGLEILSISLYVLAGSSKESFVSNEAAFKYFIMGSFATGFLLMGIALVYGATATFDISEITKHVTQNSNALPEFFYVGLFLMLIGMTFKISAVPLHFWAPDVYTGAPTMITAFMSTVVKIAAVAAFYKIFAECFIAVQSSFIGVVKIVIVLTLIVANITAVYQGNVKRMLAYSSIGHVGYILLAFMAGTNSSEGTIFYYLVSYSVTSLIAFAIVALVEKEVGSTAIDAFQGLFHRNSFAAICMTIALLSLAGIPPLAGFFAKYMVLASAINTGHVYLAILAIITSLIGVYYYFRPLIAMFSPAKTGEATHLSPFQKAVIGVLTLLTVLVGVLPDLIMQIFN
jgi:NADH-quinone oxidoreductase subunit N